MHSQLTQYIPHRITLVIASGWKQAVFLLEACSFFQCFLLVFFPVKNHLIHKATIWKPTIPRTDQVIL